MQQEQGFEYDASTELIDYTYMPCSIMKSFRYRRKSYINPLKIKALGHTIELDNNPFVNHELREEHCNEILLAEKKSVIFNSCNKDEVGSTDTNLTFDSSFQSGNLELAIKKKTHYELYMRPDTNTKAHFQWFNFKVAIKKGNKKIRFVIKNFIKATMLYNKGLKPYYFDKKGGSTEYQQLSSEVVFQEDEEDEYYNLQFEYYFQQDDNEVDFCSQPPYTYSRLLQQLKKVTCKKELLGKTVLNKRIPYLLFNQTEDPKLVVVAIARQHPGETVGSWMMEGFIKRLADKNLNPAIMWVVVPMLNIDGVIAGNTRTGILGHDFNRNWNLDENNIKQDKIFPEIRAVLKLVKGLKRKYPRKVKVFLDLHGHSSQPNVFTYGPPHQQFSQYFYLSRLFPEILSQKNHNFNLSQCSYVLKPDKKSTSRSVLFNQFGIPFTYTVESTFGVLRNKMAKASDFMQVGSDIAESVDEFIQISLLKAKKTNISTYELINIVKEKYTAKTEEIDEFQSASQASQDTPGRKNFETKISFLLEQSKSQNREEIYSKSHQVTINEQQHPLIAPSKLKNFYNKGMKMTTATDEFDPPIRGDMSSLRFSRRVETQCSSSKKASNKRNLLPKLSEKHRSCEEIFHERDEMEVPIMLSLKDIQKRLYRLKNTRVGKKILILNAYGV